MKKPLKLKKKFTYGDKPKTTKKPCVDKYPKGEVVIKDLGSTVTLKFDKNGGLWYMYPNFAGLLNTYRGRQRSENLIDEIKNELKPMLTPLGYDVF